MFLPHFLEDVIYLFPHFLTPDFGDGHRSFRLTLRTYFWLRFLLGVVAVQQVPEGIVDAIFTCSLTFLICLALLC